jgi:hypothetical protein
MAATLLCSRLTEANRRPSVATHGKTGLLNAAPCFTAPTRNNDPWDAKLTGAFAIIIDETNGLVTLPD